MASALCCTSEQPGRADSPELPNVRVSRSTAAELPLLTKDASSPNSRFTSAQSEDLHELQHIFSSLDDGSPDRASTRHLQQKHRSRPSLISLRSLHNMASMGSILRRKFSKDTPRKTEGASASKQKSKLNQAGDDENTVVKHGNKGVNAKIKVTEEDLRRDLLSDKKPDQGGYDPDAEVLDDVAKNIGKKSSGARPSVHSIEWNPSTGSKATSSSSKQSRHHNQVEKNLQPYKITKPHTVLFSSRFAQVFSSPNLRVDVAGGRDRRLRRSHSAASLVLPKPSPLSPLRLPSLTGSDRDGIPWSEVMNQSLRLSQFPSPPPSTIPKTSETVSEAQHRESPKHAVCGESRGTLTLPQAAKMRKPSPSISSRAIEIRVQQPTSTATPRPSTSLREVQESVKRQEKATYETDCDDDNPRQSVHLYSMRISHHLRSGSLLSWDQLAVASDLPTPPRPFKERTNSDHGRASRFQHQTTWHERHTSSSGFASSKVPSKWGRVISNDVDQRIDAASSTYSSRPQSPPDSIRGSLMDLSSIGNYKATMRKSSIDIRRPRRSSSFPTDNEDTPRPPQRYGSLGRQPLRQTSESSLTAHVGVPLARKNSVAETKKSKFHEEFSPSPPRKKLTPTASLMKFLPKRLSMRSQSDTNLQPDPLETTTDGHLDTLKVTNDRVRRQSVSITSLQAEQEALSQSKEPHQLWSDALRAHQKEKASLFLPQNRELAATSFLRERSGSVLSRRYSTVSEIDPLVTPSINRLSAPLLESAILEGQSSKRASEGSPGLGDSCTTNDVAEAFERQGDSPAIVGAWGRYPSHTRENRALSAGKDDDVETRDFALEAAIQFAQGGSHSDDHAVHTKGHIMSPSAILGDKKRKRRVGSGGKMAKSSSMTFGRRTIKEYYTGIFKSSSSEFRKHGRGHRSSITSGGHLENPELELLPDIFLPSNKDGIDDKKPSTANAHPEARLPATSSVATLRARRNSSAPNIREMASLHQLNDINDSSEDSQDRARVWSSYYENCVPSFPRLSADLLEISTQSPRHSLDSRRSNKHSMAMPPRTRHSRNVSQVSKFSFASRNSAQASLAGLNDVDEDKRAEEKSLVSVRQSTMDLMAKFREVEVTERERVLSLGRTESRRGAVLVE